MDMRVRQLSRAASANGACAEEPDCGLLATRVCTVTNIRHIMSSSSSHHTRYSLELPTLVEKFANNPNRQGIFDPKVQRACIFMSIIRFLFVYLIRHEMSVRIVVSCPLETAFLSELDEAVRTRGRDCLEIKVLKIWWSSCRSSESKWWDIVGQLDPLVISDVVGWVLHRSQKAFENIPITRLSLINLIKKQVLSR